VRYDERENVTTSSAEKTKAAPNKKNIKTFSRAITDRTRKKLGGFKEVLVPFI